MSAFGASGSANWTMAAGLVPLVMVTLRARAPVSAGMVTTSVLWQLLPPVPWRAALEATWLPSGSHLGCHLLGTIYHLPRSFSPWAACLSWKKNHSELAGLTLNCWSQASIGSSCPSNDSLFQAFSFIVNPPTPLFSTSFCDSSLIETIKECSSLSFLRKWREFIVVSVEGPAPHFLTFPLPTSLNNHPLFEISSLSISKQKPSLDPTWALFFSSFQSQTPQSCIHTLSSFLCILFYKNLAKNLRVILFKYRSVQRRIIIYIPTT